MFDAHCLFTELSNIFTILELITLHRISYDTSVELGLVFPTRVSIQIGLAKQHSHRLRLLIYHD